MARLTRGERTLIWFVASVCIPVIFISAIWAIQRFIYQSVNPFSEAFGTGDLIAIAALLLLGICADVVLCETRSSNFVGHMALLVIVLVCALIAYGVVKTNVIEQIANAPNYDRLASNAKISWGLLVYAVAHTTYVKFKLERKTSQGFIPWT